MGSKFTPAWIKKGFFNESLFCDDFLSTHQLLYVNGAFFTPEGRVTDTMNLRCEIFDMLRDHKTNSEERTIWDEKTMLAALNTIENPALHLAVHLSMILSLREGEILGLQPSDLDFDAADGRGTISVSKTMQRANKDALEKLDPNQVYHTFPDRREGSKSSLILLPDGLPIAPELLTKWYRQWRSAHPEFEQIVFHGLRHSSATYQLLQSDGDFKSVQGNTGHATASVLMDTYAHTQDKPRLELAEKIEANFYTQDLTPAAPQPRQNEKPAATKISGKEILEAIRLDGCRGTQRVDESLVRLTSLLFMQRKAGCAHLAQKDPLFGKCANGVQKVCSRFPT